MEHEHTHLMTREEAADLMPQPRPIHPVNKAIRGLLTALLLGVGVWSAACVIVLVFAWR